ncbi:3,4-dihydroxy-2-butanone-4-phosphate synthase [Pseudonocardia endophytica]|uniref:3,4-dihydroxy-2-butanone-4-phosphate synthase n=1 Tax=Pseudonocardia endophytica TaxID=401976 RepID=A0A4R1HM66_PSEEN|nr:3,4-dihydroxy-2-butanone-4-phosphate synthase [Pseudonocardia endophytica]TCK21410.1 3,4-dihydroxy 2-butanone 4-phosphate synthase/GTP cyclohydrolase II [Pseudonocardia endophytica]
MRQVETALAEIAAGRPVVVVDDEDRENEGDLIVAAERVDAATMSFLVRHTSGFVCVALPEQECTRLALPPLHHSNSDAYRTAYRVTVDAVDGISTGISARDRAHTARLLARPSTTATDFSRPGHVVPLAARPGGVLEREGHTEAAVDLTRLAGLRPAGVLCEIVSVREPSQMARRDELVDFAAEHGLAIVSVAQLAEYRRGSEVSVERVADADLPTRAGAGRTIGYRTTPDGGEHLALVTGEVLGGHDVPVHVHVECLLGDVFGSHRCQCCNHLDAAMREIAAGGRGIVVYLRPGTNSPLRVLQEQDATVSRLVNRSEVACAPFTRQDAAITSAILADLGIRSAGDLYNPLSVQTALCVRVPETTSSADVAAEASGAVA